MPWPTDRILAGRLGLFILLSISLLPLLPTAQAMQNSPWIQAAVEQGFRELPSDTEVPFRAWVRDPSSKALILSSEAVGGSSEAVGGSSEAVGGALEALHRAPRLIVIIESDGASWRLDGYQAPPNPTPRSPMGLQMAMQSPARDRVLYLARPCQFQIDDQTHDQRCKDNRWWTDWRFHPQIVDRFKAAVVAQQALHGKDSLLIFAGFSGGGTLATLLAMTFQSDKLITHDPDQVPGLKPIPLPSVTEAPLCLITLASPLDLNQWAGHHRLTSFTDVPSGQQIAEALSSISSLHAYGDRDRKVPLESAGRFLSAENLRQRVHRFTEQSHDARWISVWPRLLEKAC
ncbi:MAG: hypothetical protein KGR21_02505 [Proteobacteria bacterium]|nr:hypothetical protein [Pseudomonadota bacterium]